GHLAAGDLPHAGDRILAIDFDRVVGAEGAGHRETAGIGRAAGDDDAAGTGLARRDGAGEAELAGSENDDGVVDADAAFALYPPDAVRQRDVKRRLARRHGIGKPVQAGVGIEMDIFAEAAPQAGRHRHRGEAVHLVHLDAAAKIVAAGRAEGAAAARHIFLHGDAVALLDAPALRRVAPDAMDVADDLVAEDDRRRETLRPRAGIGRPVDAADARHLDAQCRGLVVDLRHGQLPEIDRTRTGEDRGPGGKRHDASLSWVRPGIAGTGLPGRC